MVFGEPFLAGGPGGFPRRPRILIVGHDPAGLALVFSCFDGAFEVALEGASEPALGKCREDPPDLVLLDSHVRGLDGLTFCRELKADPATRDLPVIFITSPDEPQEENAALSAGAADFIPKPVNPAVVKARVRTHLTAKFQSDYLRSLISLDGLTGLADRRRLDEYLELTWRRSTRSRSPMTLLMTDLDRFKPYNAQYGQQAGDECLRTVAGAIRRCHRRHQDLPARYDGAEFACVLPDTGRPGGRHLAEAIQRSLRDLAIPHGGSETGFVTLSIGIGSLIPGPELPVSALVTTAYQALCRAKANGRNRVED